MCSRCGETEPELRRWAARRMSEASLPLSHDIRRRSDPGPAEQLVAAAAPDEIVLSVEPFGDHLEVCAISNGRAQLRRVEGDGGLGDFRTAAQFEPAPSRLAAAAARVGESVFTSLRGAPASVRRVVVSVPEVYGFLPFDLVPFEDGQILDRFEIVIVPSVTQLARARFLPEPPMLSELPAFTSRLEARHAIVRREPVDPAARARLFQLLGEAQNAGAGASAALRQAKLALRAQWKPDPSKPAPGVPPWASFLLRGAP